jgi:hypothetical protein
MRFAVGVTSALGLGGILGFIAGWAALEERTHKKYEVEYAAAQASMQRAYEMALNEEPEIAGDTILGTVEVTSDEDGVTATVTSMTAAGLQIFDPQNPDPFTPETVNPYHVAVQAPATPIEMFVGGQPNAEGISYVEDEEYLEEDGRLKQRIEILIDETNPLFFLDGVPIDDWAARVGSSILADMYERTPPGLEAVLYVRNHRTDEDYEVVFITP